MLLSLQGKCGQGDPLECHWLRSIDILGIRNQSQCSLALQATQCFIQIHHDPPSFPSFVKESGVHGPRHGLRWFFRRLCPKWWHWVRTVPSRLGLCEEHHGKDHRQSQCGPALCTVPGWSKNLQCHCHWDVAGLLGKKKVVEQTKFAHFCTVFYVNLRPVGMLQANFVPCTEWLWLRHDAPTAQHQQGLEVPKFPCLWRRPCLFNRIDRDVRRRLEWKDVKTFFQFVKLYDWGSKPTHLSQDMKMLDVPNAQMTVRDPTATCSYALNVHLGVMQWREYLD